MLSLQRTFLVFLFLCYSVFADAQDKADVTSLIKQGAELHNAGKYAEAVAKYKEALQTDPDNAAANYQTAFSLAAAKNNKEALPYAEKATQTTSAYTAAAYNLLGGIYDADHQPEKAITVYKEGIKAYPQYQSLYFNLGIACFRSRQYADAEIAAIEAIKLDPKHANSQRLYALVTFHQNKRMNALLGFCSFLLLEPNTSRSEEAYTNLQSILKGGVLKHDDVAKPLLADAKEIAALNAGIASVITSAQAKKLTGAALLEYQLKSIFTIAGQAAEKKTEKSFYDIFYAAYFYKLAQSGNMAAFARLAGLSGNKAENTQWQQEHEQQVSDLDNWVKGTERGFR